MEQVEGSQKGVKRILRTLAETWPKMSLTTRFRLSRESKSCKCVSALLSSGIATEQTRQLATRLEKK
jgi:hypothetical protein